MSFSTKMTARGPLFDGRAVSHLRNAVDEAKSDVADHGMTDVHQFLSASLRNPTGYYESHIMTQRQVNDYVVFDGGVIYGPWLEGTSSRNSTTRFKGYASFRKATQQLRAQANSLAERVIQRYLGRMS